MIGILKRIFNVIKYIFVAPPMPPTEEELLEKQKKLILEAKRKYALEVLHVDDAIMAKNEKFKNIHKAKRCFILGNGPSLKNQDLSLLKDEIVFTTNYAYKLEQFKDINTNYHFFYDPTCFENEYLSIAELSRLKTENNVPHIFFEYSKGYPLAKKIEIDKFFDVSYFYDLFTIDEELFELKNNPIEGMTGFHTVVQKAISYAIYMGCSEIYLLGCDCTAILLNIALETGESVEVHAYVEDEKINKKTKKIIIDKDIDNMEKVFFSNAYVFKAYRLLRDYCERNGILFANATYGGVLNSLPRVKYESLFEVIKTNLT